MYELDNRRKLGNFNNEGVARSFAYDFFQIRKASEDIYKNKEKN